MLLEPPPQPKFVASPRRNRCQVEVRFRKLDHLPDAVPIATGHDVIPPARLGGLLLEPPPVDVPGVDAQRLRRLVGVGERQFVLAAQLLPNPISPFRATEDRGALRPQAFPAFAGPTGVVPPRPSGVVLVEIAS